ncbi:MAG TPA: ABC transporter ATP-binding protein [Longimicrobiaceae bacterium]|nr:ABC transporter ATP-binding protein [Longimicrobiaceae bacterium]
MKGVERVRERVKGASANTPAIRCMGLHKRFSETIAVRSVDLDVQPGECFGLLGPNGAGKTTTIEILEGLLSPDDGVVEIFGQGWHTHARELRPRLGIQLQETEFPDRLTVRETIALFRSVYPAGPGVEELIEQVQLGEKRDDQVRVLSGGQRQRLSLACALAGSPDILFLDEPTTGLDPQSRRHIWDICRAFQQAGGTILLTTHFMDEAERLTDRLAIMDHGSILVEGTPRDLKASLGGDHVVEFESTLELPPADLASLPAVTRIDRSGTHLRLTTAEPHRTIPALYRMIDRRGGELTSLNTHHATLDDVFLALTGRQLRDA